jgi:hypothetical protein
MIKSNYDHYNRLKQTESDLHSFMEDKAVDICVLRQSLELEHKINICRKEEKQIAKKEKKSGDGNKLLKKIQKMPHDVMLLIRGYLPYDVHISLIKDKFISVMNKCKGGKSQLNGYYVYDYMGSNAPQLFVQLLKYAATCPELLPLLSRDDARLQIPSLTPIGSYWRFYTYCYPSNDYYKHIDTIVKNKINWIVELAQAGNPKFAYKIMKTAIVFCSSLRKYRPSYTVKAYRHLTIEDLPPDYR